ncbi:hypothetical protein C8J57DRAFT_496325 [Mycena rebaudengoi]|nr:hypothetical protein C8J57DRAFT_496325 [Mycena rebaudengoi]
MLQSPPLQMTHGVSFGAEAVRGGCLERARDDAHEDASCEIPRRVPLSPEACSYRAGNPLTPPSRLCSPSCHRRPTLNSFLPILRRSLEAIDYPDKTLVTPSATNIAQRKEQREHDARYCAKHFPEHVVLSPLHVVLARLGAPVLAEKFEQLREVACNGLDERLEAAVLNNFSDESIPSSRAADRVIDNRYWLSRLADVGFVPSESISCTPLTR